LIKWIHVLCNNFPLFLPYANRIYSIIPELLSRLAYQRIILILKTKQQNVLCNICMTPYQLFGFSLDPKSLSSNILSNSKHFFAHPEVNNLERFCILQNWNKIFIQSYFNFLMTITICVSRFASHNLRASD